MIPDKITDPFIYLRLRGTSTDNTPWDNQNYSDETYQWARSRSEDPSIPGVRVNPNDNSSWEYMGNRDWTEYFLNDYTVSQNHNISLGGRTKKVTYYLSAGYDRQRGVLKIADDHFDRYMVCGKVNFTPKEWITVGNNTAFRLSERVKPSGLSIQEFYDFHPSDFDKTQKALDPFDEEFDWKAMEEGPDLDDPQEMMQE